MRRQLNTHAEQQTQIIKTTQNSSPFTTLGQKNEAGLFYNLQTNANELKKDAFGNMNQNGTFQQTKQFSAYDIYKSIIFNH